MRITRRTLCKVGLSAGAAGALARPARARESRQPLPGAVGMLHDATRCVGCGACMAACKEANQLAWDAPKELSSTTKTVVKKRPLAKASAPSAFIKRQCMHCVDPSCVSVCVLGAMHKEGEGKRDMGGERKGSGLVLYDPDLCLGCRYCQIACAFAVPKFEWRERSPRIVKCELCRQRRDPTRQGPLALANPACCQVCPSGALVYGSRRDLVAEAHRRLQAEPARYNGKVYGEADGGGTQVLYLAPRGATFAELGLPDLAELAPAQLSESTSHAPYLHGVTPIALYAAAAWIVRRNRRRQDEQAGRGEEKPCPATRTRSPSAARS